MPSVFNRSSNWIVLVLQTWQSVCPITAISLPPLTAQASASDRIVLLNGAVMMLPAFRSQMNCSPGKPSTFGNNEFNRGSTQVSAITGSSLSYSAT